MEQQLTSMQRKMRDWAHLEPDEFKRYKKISAQYFPCSKCKGKLMNHSSGLCKECRTGKCGRCKQPRTFELRSGPHCANCVVILRKMNNAL